MGEDLIIYEGKEISRRDIERLPPCCDLYSMYLNDCDVKESTKKGYEVCGRAFLLWIAQNGIDRPTREDIKAYKKHLEEQDFTAGTRAQYLRAVKGLFHWASTRGLYPNITDGVKGVKVRQDNTKKDPLQAEDVRRILSSIDRSSETGKRDYAMFLLSITGGLRIIELQRADIGDIKTIAGEKVLFIQGKGRDEKDEYKKLPPAVFSAIMDYLSIRGETDKKAPLFTGTSNRAKEKRLTEPSISRIIKGVLVSAGYDSDRLTAHSLRHTSVTLLLEAGATLQEAQHHARHADPATTGIYAHNIDRRKDQSEQIIFNQIFNSQKADAAQEAAQIVKGMTPEQQQEALAALIEIANRRGACIA